jgi:hypothetical protein
VFSPRSSNHRFCRQLECRRLLRRWQDAKRQRRFRSREENRQQHAEAERQRRLRQRETRATTVDVEQPPPRVPSEQAPCAWSRSERILHDFCDRPGCYAPLCGIRRGPCQYCAGDCRQAERRVQDRERKFKARQKEAAQREAQEQAPAHPAGAPRTISAGEWRRYQETSKRSAARVRTSSTPVGAALSSRDVTECPNVPEEVSEHDPEASLGSRPRAPPSG